MFAVALQNLLEAPTLKLGSNQIKLRCKKLDDTYLLSKFGGGQMTSSSVKTETICSSVCLGHAVMSPFIVRFLCFSVFLNNEIVFRTMCKFMKFSTRCCHEFC